MAAGVVGVPQLRGQVRQVTHVLLHDEIPPWPGLPHGSRADRAPDGWLAGSLFV